jgi:hypothetical protein
MTTHHPNGGGLGSGGPQDLRHRRRARATVRTTTRKATVGDRPFLSRSVGTPSGESVNLIGTSHSMSRLETVQRAVTALAQGCPVSIDSNTIGFVPRLVMECGTPRGTRL